MYLGKMLVQMFFGVLPYELVLRIWDAVFLDGPGVIMAASILIFKINKSESIFSTVILPQRFP